MLLLARSLKSLKVLLLRFQPRRWHVHRSHGRSRRSQADTVVHSPFWWGCCLLLPFVELVNSFLAKMPCFEKPEANQAPRHHNMPLLPQSRCWNRCQVVWTTNSSQRESWWLNWRCAGEKLARRRKTGKGHDMAELCSIHLNSSTHKKMVCCYLL